MKAMQAMKYIKPPNLTLRKWLILAWLSYALLPGVALGIGYGIAWLALGGDTARLASPNGAIITFAVLVQIGVLVGVGLFMGRTVASPLAAISRAARQVAAGQLEVALPHSPVREVREVSADFAAMTRDLRAAVARQAALEQERQFFVSAVAHDLRTPLFSLRGYLEGLQRGVASTPAKVAQYVEVCQRKADELDHLVADLFAYTQVEALEQRMARAPLDLASVLAEAVEGLRPRAEKQAVSLALNAPPEPVRIQGDAHLLSRALTNLLDNALRHTPAGGAVSVRLDQQGDRLTCTISDTGPGFAARDLPHLFEPLYRGEDSRSRETGGAGLGLTIARRILRAHGGDLTAANRPEGGAELSATLWVPQDESRTHVPLASSQAAR